MAAPTFISFSTYNASGLNPTSYTPNVVGGGAWVADDILVAAFETDSNPNASEAGGGETWTSFGVQGVGGSTIINAWWARATQTNPPAPTFNFGTTPNHAVGAVCALRGCHASGNPWETMNGGSNSVANATIPGAATGVVDTLVLLLCSSGFNGTSSTRFSAWTNANLGSLTERFDQVDTIGNGGGFGAATGTWASTGNYGNTTVTEGFTGHGYFSIAFKPPQAQVSLALPRKRERLHVPMMYPEVAWA